jgi:hypothetical protein
MHQGKVWNTKQFNQNKLRHIQQERVVSRYGLAEGAPGSAVVRGVEL